MSTQDPQTDEELLSRMQSGDEQAFLTLYRRRQGSIYRFAVHMSGSAAVAEDVTQEVFLALIRERCGFDPARGTLAAYLFGIARKLVLRFTERTRSDVALEADEDDFSLDLAVVEDPLIDLTRRESLDALWRAVKALPRKYREVVILCDLEEMDYSDAAQVLGCPIGTVRSRLHRARAHLLEKLNPERNTKPLMRGLKPIRCVV